MLPSTSWNMNANKAVCNPRHHSWIQTAEKVLPGSTTALQGICLLRDRLSGGTVKKLSCKVVSKGGMKWLCMGKNAKQLIWRMTWQGICPVLGQIWEKLDIQASKSHSRTVIHLGMKAPWSSLGLAGYSAWQQVWDMPGQPWTDPLFQ